jgi:hypothetical protein
VCIFLHRRGLPFQGEGTQPPARWSMNPIKP